VNSIASLNQNNIARQKTVAYARHVLRRSRGISVAFLSEGKLNRAKTLGWPSRNYIDNIKEWD